MCIFFVPITWIYISTLYKGDNITRLTTDPPLIKFDDFKMLEKHQFNTYSPRLNLQDLFFARRYNNSVINKLIKKHGAVRTHENFPVVSEFWYHLMYWLRPYPTFELSLNFLKDEIPKQIWRYINNSKMLPNYGEGTDDYMKKNLNFHMKKCNKSAIILPRMDAYKMHSILKQMKKPVYLGKDKIIENFWGYKFMGYFPKKYVFRVRYIFQAGIFQWWQKHFDYSLDLKLNIHAKRLMSLYNQTRALENNGNKTVVAKLSFIYVTGLIISFIIFVCVEVRARENLFQDISVIFVRFQYIFFRMFRKAFNFSFQLKTSILLKFKLIRRKTNLASCKNCLLR